MQSCFKIDLDLVKLSNVKILCLQARVFLVTIVKWGCLGKDISNWPGFQDSYCLNLQRELSKRLTLSAVLKIFVTEDLFIYIYFLSFEENHRNRISRAGKNLSNDFARFP